MHPFALTLVLIVTLPIATAQTADPVNGAGIFDNSDWRFAMFTTDGAHRTGTNEAKCLACHKPEHACDYVFTLVQLNTFAKSK